MTRGTGDRGPGTGGTEPTIGFQGEDIEVVSPTVARGGLRAAAIRFSVLAAVILTGLVVVRFTPLRENLTPERLKYWLELVRGAWWSPFALVAGYAVAAVIALPITPLLMAGAVLFGIGLGTVYNLVGCMVGAAIGYGFAASLGRGFVLHVLGSRIGAIEQRLAHRQGFWTLTRARLLPIPFPIFNFAAALVGVRFRTFIASSAVGLILPVLLNTVLWASLAEASNAERAEQLLMFGLLLPALFLLSFFPGWWVRRREGQKNRDRGPGNGDQGI